MLRKLKVSMKEFIGKSKLNSSNLPQKYLQKKNKNKNKSSNFFTNMGQNLRKMFQIHMQSLKVIK